MILTVLAHPTGGTGFSLLEMTCSARITPPRSAESAADRISVHLLPLRRPVQLRIAEGLIEPALQCCPVWCLFVLVGFCFMGMV